MKVERDGRIVAVRPSVVPAAAQVLSTNAEVIEFVALSTNGVKDSTAASNQNVQHFTRPPTSSGGRNMQDTTFSLSAEYPSK